MSDVEVSDEPIVLSTEIATDHGVETTKTQAYTPPLDGTFDPHRAMDMRIARAVATVLDSKYPSYPWKVISEIRQGMVAFQLPELMGATLHVFIRLADYNDLSDKLIIETAGNLLERMGLPRSRCDLDAYNAAKLRLHTFDFADVGRKRFA